jgi:hypothetical protein
MNKIYKALLFSFILCINSFRNYCDCRLFFVFKVPEGHALISKKSKQGRFTADGWNFSLSLPAADNLVRLQKNTLNLPRNDKFIELETPDDGCVGVKVSITYSPDDSNGNALLTYKSTMDLDKAIAARVQSALNNWIKGKPLPGTARRALTMKDEAENFVRAKITSVPTSEALAVHNDPSLYYQGGYPVNDLGVRVYEVHVTEMQNLERGTGKPDWGDGDEMTFNAQNIFKQFHAHADNLSNLRKLKEALLERYPDEQGDIEDIYDQVRISMKENRDR